MPVTPSKSMHRPRWPRRITLILVVWLLACGTARANVTTLDGTQAPIVRVNVRGGDVTIRTWERESVQIDGDPSLSIVRRITHQPLEQNPVLIPQAQQPSRGGPAFLPAESFVVSSIPAGPREAIVVRSETGTAAGPVIVTVPNDSVYIFAFVRDGNLDVHDYRGGTLVGFTARGRLALDDVGGTVFAQTGRGALTATDSVTERLRARSLFGNMTFERCRSRQIEATSVEGSIVYDGGSFDPGLARFESARGNVAIGTRSAAQLGARAGGDGRVYTNFERAARIESNRDETIAAVDGGGPLVTATSQSGNVYLYDGTLRTRERLGAQWRAPIRTLERPALRALRATRPNAEATQPRAGVPLPRAGVPLPRAGVPLPRAAAPLPRAGAPLPRAVRPRSIQSRPLPRFSVTARKPGRY